MALFLVLEKKRKSYEVVFKKWLYFNVLGYSKENIQPDIPDGCQFYF